MNHIDMNIKIKINDINCILGIIMSYQSVLNFLQLQ